MKIMMIILAIALVVALGVGLGFYWKAKAGSTTDNHDLEKSIDEDVYKLFKLQNSHGVMVGIVKNGRVLQKSYGIVEKANDAKPNGQTVFQIASITKVFTASLLQSLVDQGVVRMDSMLGELIGDAVPMNDKAARITLEQLAAHTSGLPRIPKPMLKKVRELA